MKATVEQFDPIRHGPIVRDFVASAMPDVLGFRQNQLSQEDWLHLLQRADAAGGKYAAVLLSRDGMRAVVVPTIRSWPVSRSNAFLHIVGKPDSRMIAEMADRLASENIASFCQTLVSAEAIEAQQVLLDAGAAHVEDEIFMRAENLLQPMPRANRSAMIVRAAAPSDAASLEQLHQSVRRRSVGRALDLVCAI